MSVALVGVAVQSRPVAAATPPPTPPPITAPVASSAPVFPNAISTPIPIPSGYGLPGAPKLKATPTPPPSARKGIEGVWEVQIQRGDNTEYAHFNIKNQAGNVLTGVYRKPDGKLFPLSGSVDGTNVRLVVSMPDGTTLLLQGRLSGTSDMLGMLTSQKGEVYFTASWRPKEKWIENITPGTGLGGMGGGLPNGGPP